MEVKTWQDLADRLAAMSPEQRKQPVQVVKPTPREDDVQEGMPGIALATVGELEFYKYRSTHDNKYHADDVVLLIDLNPFAEDGAVAYGWGPRGPDAPIYGKDGPTPPESQYSPRAALPKPDKRIIPAHVLRAVQSRIDAP